MDSKLVMLQKALFIRMNQGEGFLLGDDQEELYVPVYTNDSRGWHPVIRYSDLRVLDKDGNELLEEPKE